MRGPLTSGSWSTPDTEGFALGLGREVIWIVRKDDMKNVDFDTDHFAHITWETPEELRVSLTRRIQATISPVG